MRCKKRPFDRSNSLVHYFMGKLMFQKLATAFFILLSARLHAGPTEDPERPIATTKEQAPMKTLKSMMLPAGFGMELIASEPAIVQPIAYTMDDRGRLWVLENMNYPQSPGEPKDRILVLEDIDGNGSYEKQTVFWVKANFSSGIATGFGGVFLGSPPHLLFIPDRNDDLIPDGEAEVLLDGWGAEDTHETLNSFAWGPDGWLYGTQGVFTHSNVGKPGTENAQRVPINCGVWRYHPQRRAFERWCEGVSNQWGLDWNDRGEAFFAACVIPHMWHGIEGAHYQRQAGSHFNPYVYEDIPHIAWGSYEKAAFCGAMIYLGGAFPAQWRDNFFFNDIHASMIRCETFLPDGSGFTSARKQDFLISGDKWFRGLSPQYGPDGGVFVNDWYDKVPCHQQKAFTDRSNGRIYKIVTNKVTPRMVNLSAASDIELVEMQLHPNDWYVRHSRRLLQERGAQPATTSALEAILFHHPDETRQLRALWVLHSQGALTEASALRIFAASSESLRGWAVTSVCESGRPSPKIVARLLEMAKQDPSAIVRRRLSSAIQKFSPSERWPLIEALVSHEDDINDRNIPILNWYAMEPAIAENPLKGIEVLQHTPQPRLHQYIARRVLSLVLEHPVKNASAMEALIDLLGVSDSTKREAMLTGILDAAEGQQSLPEAQTWPQVYAKLEEDKAPSVREQARTLALLFGSDAALEALHIELRDPQASAEARKAALTTLASRSDPALLEPLLEYAKVAGPLREQALQTLAKYADSRISEILVANYTNMTAEERTAALHTLVARPESALVLMAAFDSGQIPHKDLGASLARLMQSLQRQDIDEWLMKNFGALHPNSTTRLEEIEKYKKFLGTEAILAADVKNGQALFQRTCMACHELFGEGGHIGPELPGNYTDIDYLLGNILDPNAEIGRDFQQTYITTKSGNLIVGVLVNEDAQSLTLKTLVSPVTITHQDIAKRELSPLSMMPEGLLQSLQEHEVRDLFLYLRQAFFPKKE